MRDTLLVCSQVLAGGVGVFVGVFLVCALLGLPRPGAGRLGAGLAASLILHLVLAVMQGSAIYSLALESLLVAWIPAGTGPGSRTGIGWVLPGSHSGNFFRMGLFVGIFYGIAIAFLQFLLGAGLGILFGTLDFLERGTIGGQCVLWLVHLLSGVLVLWLFRCGKLDGQRIYRIGSAVALAGFLATVTLSQQQILKIPEDTLQMWTILAVVLLMSTLVFHMNRQYEVEKELAALRAEQAQLLERDYTALNQAYAANAKLFHDFHNHIGVLRRLLSQEKAGEAIRYLDELQAPVRELGDRIWTGDETADYLISSKAALAAGRGIAFSVQAEYPRHANIRSADLCAILGNLLDNALEAAGQVPEPDRRQVSLTIRRIHQMLVIKVENSFREAPLQEGGEYRTTKKDGGLHGWGLKSARTAAEKYDGSLQAGQAGEVFRAVATLSYHGV